MNARRLFIAYLIVLLAGLVTATPMGRISVEFSSGPGGLAAAHLIRR